jgi:hypothetical protein
VNPGGGPVRVALEGSPAPGGLAPGGLERGRMEA